MSRKVAQCLLSLPKQEVKSLFKSFNAILTDCDGVLWIADDVIPGAPQSLNALRAEGKKIFYVTNNSTKTQDEFLVKAHKLGFEAEKHEMISTSYLAANYLKRLNFKKKVYVIGGKGITQELDFAQIRHTEVGPDNVQSSWIECMTSLQLDPEVGAVLVAFDEHFSWVKLARAISYLNNPEVLFLATNTDERFPTKNDMVVPGTGCLVRAVETGAERPAFVLGKPAAYICDALREEHNIQPETTLMIGDRCNTDILLGKRCGYKTLLVLTGVTKLEDVRQWEKSEKEEERDLVPDYFVNSIGDLLDLIK